MIDWTDPETVEKAAKATLSVGVVLKKLKQMFKGKKPHELNVTHLKMLVLVATALDAQNESIKQLFTCARLTSEFAQAKQAEAGSFLTLLLQQESSIAGLRKDVNRQARRIDKLTGLKKPKSKRGRKKM